MHFARVVVKAGLWCALAALSGVTTLWASAPVKRVAPGRAMQSQIVALRATGASSPGIVVCQTTYDLQHDDGTVRQVASLGGGELAHFAWTQWDIIPGPLDEIYRFVNYQAYGTATGFTLAGCGTTLGILQPPRIPQSGRAGVDVGSDGNAHVTLHQLDEVNQQSWSDHIFSSWVFDQAFSGDNVFDGTRLDGSVNAEAIWPHGAIDRGGSSVKSPGDDVYHVCSKVTGDLAPYTDELFYWRRIGEYGSLWEGPVVLDHAPGGSLSHHVATDPTSENVAVVYASDLGSPASLLQVLYLESTSNGADWIAAGVPAFPNAVGPSVNGGRQYVTDYMDPDGPAAWNECTGEFDSQGRLHVVWIEQAQAGMGDDCRILHWDDASFTTRSVAEAIGWGTAGVLPYRSLWLTSPQLGFGDGNTLCTDGPSNPGGAGATSNLDYLYVTFEQYGGPTSAEANDVSAHGFQNAEIYLAASNDRGASWAIPVNLTNTQTPGCDGTVSGSECASEKDPSINLIVDDTLHLFYMLDTDAGEAVLGQGAWTYNPMMYDRIPGGTDTQPLCPALTPEFAQMLSNSDPDCEYHATLNPPGTVVEQLSIINSGNAPLTGSVAVTPPSETWLQVSPAGFSVLPGGAPDVRPVTMDAGDVSISGEGLYSGQIEITHNDPAIPSPFVVPVDFFVFDEFYCPEYVTLHTDCLWLKVSNTERVGNQNTGLGGLTRRGSDSSWSVYDGSLLIGVPPNPDTLVYRTVYGSGNGYPGFRALGNLVIDTSAYGTFNGNATATAQQTTSDSTIGIDVEYVFPQGPDSCEFVLINYRLTNNTGGDLLDLVVGEAVDFDVMPSVDQSALQFEQNNTGHLRYDYNLLYQEGVDTSGHVVAGDNTATRFKAGITALQCEPSPHGWIAANTPWLTSTASGGFEEGYLYREMTQPLGFEVLNGAVNTDLHSVVVFDNNVDLAPGESRRFQVGLVSSNTGTDETDLIETTKKAWRYAFGWQDVVSLDTVNEGAAKSYPYHAIGLHEDGFAGGCCGCVVTKVSGSPFLTVGGGEPGGCDGTIELAGGVFACYFPLEATFEVQD